MEEVLLELLVVHVAYLGVQEELVVYLGYGILLYLATVDLLLLNLLYRVLVIILQINLEFTEVTGVVMELIVMLYKFGVESAAGAMMVVTQDIQFQELQLCLVSIV
jgi:hypothetical protein